MDFNESLFFEIHSGLPQEAPGSDESTRRALQLIPNLPQDPIILDIGCGPGRQTLVLAQETGGHITAIDTHQPFLDELKRRAVKAKLADKIITGKCSMAELPFADGSFDLIWSEGAIYVMGFAEGLRAWRRLLKPGGYVAVTEVNWLNDNPPKRLAAWWRQEYPGITTIDRSKVIIAECGYELIGSFALPETDWSENYYGPLQERIFKLRVTYTGNSDAQAFLDTQQHEIDLYEQYGGYYGYVFYVMRNP